VADRSPEGIEKKRKIKIYVMMSLLNEKQAKKALKRALKKLTR